MPSPVKNKPNKVSEAKQHALNLRGELDQPPNNEDVECVYVGSQRWQYGGQHKSLWGWSSWGLPRRSSRKFHCVEQKHMLAAVFQGF